MENKIFMAAVADQGAHCEIIRYNECIQLFNLKTQKECFIQAKDI